MMLDEAYKARSTDVLPGLKGIYMPRERFEHGVPMPVALVEARCSDGHSVGIIETRLPARFFRLEAQPRVDADGRTVPGFTLETGTMEPRLVAEIANAIAEGMLGVVP